MPPLGPALARIKRDRIKAVSLEGGGEPSVRPDLLATAAKLRAAGVEHIMLSTNGVALADMELCREAAAAIDQFTVNFPSHLPEVYAAATRSVKYPQAVRGLRNLLDLGVRERLRVFHIISSFNFRALPGFAAWAAENLRGAGLVNLTFVRNAGRARGEDGIVPSYSEAAPFIKLALARLKLAGFKAVVQNFPLCMLKGFEGFSFEFQRWSRGDAVFEEGVASAADCAACAACALAPACCGARTDYGEIRGFAELKASRIRPSSIKPERF